jgi:hypothetical protein
MVGFYGQGIVLYVPPAAFCIERAAKGVVLGVGDFALKRLCVRVVGYAQKSYQNKGVI